MNTVKMSSDSIKLWANKPASIFDEAYPVGNGTLGAMLFGDPEKDQVIFNHDQLWSGYPIEKLREGRFESLEKTKQLIREKKYTEANVEITQNFCCYSTQSYMPFGTLFIENVGAKEKISSYKRSLDLKKALFYVTYDRGNVKYNVESFVSHPDKAVVYRVCASRENAINIRVGMESSLYSKTYVEGENLCLEVECPVTSEANVSRSPDRKTLYFDDPKKRGIRAMATVEFITDGRKTNMMNAMQINNASFVEIRLCMATSFNGHKKHPFTEGKDFRGDCQKIVEALKKRTYEDIRKDHIKDYSKYFNRLAIDLGSDNLSRVPTAKRLERYAKGGSDKALPALLFNYGRYLTIAASRKGSEPMNLQGIWNKDFSPAWLCNYTMNINLEMNYFGTIQTGLVEMYEPLIRLVKELAENGKRTAKELYHADGWCAHICSDIWRQTETPIGSSKNMFWQGAGGWLSHHLWEYYEYTLDEKFLQKTAYPIIEGAAKFYLSQLETVDGYRLLFPSTSPENVFWDNDKKVAVSETAEMTMAIVREHFGNLIKAAEILGYNSEVVEKVKVELPNLLPIQIGEDGRVLEWYGECKEVDVTHRHVSHMYALHPGHEVDPNKDPEIAEACKKTLEKRSDNGTGWSIAWKANFWARLLDGDHALKLIKRQLEPVFGDGVNPRRGGTYANLLCSCPPFQIDGNFGAMSAICEMFLQSKTDTLHIIPAMPGEWKNVSIRGLRAKGNRVVDICVKDGQLAYCKIKGTKPNKIFVNGTDLTHKFVTNENFLEFSF